MHIYKDLVKGFNHDIGPYKIFDEKVINFLNEISKKILKLKKYKKFNDLVTFAFWCRKKNIINLSSNYKKNNLIVGRGCAFHVCPSNVPMNFAYSFAFGLLSGNNNIVKLPSKKFYQVNYLIKEINLILKKKKFNSIKKKLKFIRYKHNDEVSSYLSKIANVRLIWGGDETVKLFKKYETKPRCIDLCFSNRVSGALFDLNMLANLNETSFFNLVYKFYNDSYLMDQQGCSSPQILFWLGKKNIKTIDKFWKILSEIVEDNYDFDLSLANKKIQLTSEILIKEKSLKSLTFKNLKVVRYQKKDYKKFDKLENKFGTFLEAYLKKITDLKPLINERFQTLLYFGVKKEKIISLVERKNLNGIDRVVPVGRAFDMGLIWDGFDIITSLSRTIGE